MKTCAHSGLSVVLVITVHKADDLAGDVVQVEYGRICVQTGGMKLVTVFHGQVPKHCKVSLTYSPDHLLHTTRHHNICPALGKAV